MTSEARCQPHGAPVTGACARCGAFTCDACGGWAAERRHCAACLARLGDRPSRQANLALLLSTFGLCLGLPGVAGLVLAQRELGRIRRGEASPAGADTAALARAVGVASLVMLALALAWLARQA